MSSITDSQFLEILNFCSLTKLSSNLSIYEYINQSNGYIMPIEFHVFVYTFFKTSDESLKKEIVDKIRRYYENYEDEEFENLPHKKRRV